MSTAVRTIASPTVTHKSAADKLAARFAISLNAVEEAIRRGLLGFVVHRGVDCWRFGDTRNGCLRRLDGQPFKINGKPVKAGSETSGESWHQLIGLEDIVANDRSVVLFIPEGSKDALAALHFADAEDSLARVGIAVALGSGAKLLDDDLEKLRSRRVRIFADIDPAGNSSAERIAERLASVAAEVQIFALAGLKRDDGLPVKDLYDLTRIGYDEFETNRDLWSITDLDNKSERIKRIPARIFFPASSITNLNKQKFFLSPSFPPHVFPECHGFPVYPVSSSQELEKELEELAMRNACTECNTARDRRWQLERDLKAVQKRIARKLTPDELTRTLNKWHSVSQVYLDPKKTRDDYLGMFLAELGKVRVPTGEGEALKKALEHVLTLSVFELPVLPGIAEAPESWRRLAALHRELARQSASGTYFLSCRDAAKVDATLNKDSAAHINLALAQIDVIELLRVGSRGKVSERKASEYRYLLSLEIADSSTEAFVINPVLPPSESVLLTTSHV